MVGGPFIGWVCQHWSPRTGLAVAGTATVTAAATLFASHRARLLDPDHVRYPTHIGID